MSEEYYQYCKRCGHLPTMFKQFKLGSVKDATYRVSCVCGKRSDRFPTADYAIRNWNHFWGSGREQDEPVLPDKMLGKL